MMGSGFATCATHAAGACDAQNPWPGLLQYQEADREFFHGRRTETDELLRLVMRARLSVLFGLSGLGKSSLLRAGLFPRLRSEENILPVYLRLDFNAERPDFGAQAPDFGAQVLEELLNEAAASGIEAPSPVAFNASSASTVPAMNGATLWEYFHRADAGFWDKKNRPVTPLFVFDQFEEIFTLGRANPTVSQAVESFLDELSDLAEGRAPRSVKQRLETHPEESAQYSFSRHNYKILFTIREDFLPELEGLRERFTDLALNRMRLRVINGEAALTVVRQAPELVDEDVAEHIVRFVAAAQPGQKLAEAEADPAILSVVCYELNNQRRQRHEAKITQELLEGSKEEVLGKFCEGAFEGLPKEVRYFVEDKLLTASGHRDSCAQENALRFPGVTQSAIDRLVERRLIRRDEQRGVARLELAHDRLATPIKLNREKRHEAEELERERALARAAQEREHKAVADLRAARRRWAILAAISVTAIALALVAIYASLTIQRERQHRLAELIWTDSRTGLTWTRIADSPDSRDLKDEQAAARYCQELRLAGNADWRLPQVSELLAVAKSEDISKHRYIYRAGDVWSQSLASEGATANGWLQSPDGHWTVKTEYSVGSRALCVRGTARSGAAGAVLPANFTFVPIPAGSFQMGCSPGDNECTDDEKPRHSVTIDKPFEINQYPVTQATWEGVMGSNPSRFKKDGADRPVESVSWFDVQVFLSVLNERHDGYHYRLPTEAEWEYAARAGTTAARYGELKDVAWYGENSGDKTNPVGGKNVNAWGLHDMLGNVWEWVQDRYGKNFQTPAPKSESDARIKRGGSWVDLPLSIRASRRIREEPDSKNANLGFRCVREAAR